MFFDLLTEICTSASQVLESTTEKQAAMREGDQRSGATFCLLMCPAATLKSAAGIHRVKGESPVHQARDAQVPPYRNR